MNYDNVTIGQNEGEYVIGRDNRYNRYGVQYGKLYKITRKDCSMGFDEIQVEPADIDERKANIWYRAWWYRTNSFFFSKEEYLIDLMTK